jgi:hypothetical protein
MAKGIKTKTDTKTLPSHLLAQLDKYALEPTAIVENADDWEMLGDTHQSSGTTPTVLEQVLLALIRGHKLDKSKNEGEQKRLRTAMKAISGQDQFWSPWLDPDRKYIEQIIRISEHEGNLNIILASGAKGKARNNSNMALTRIATLSVRQINKKGKASLSEYEIAHVKNIVEKFTGTYFRKQKSLRVSESKKHHFLSTNFPLVWFHISRRHDQVEESLELQTVERILEEFGKFSINYEFEPPWK